MYKFGNSYCGVCCTLQLKTLVEVVLLSSKSMALVLLWFGLSSIIRIIASILPSHFWRPVSDLRYCQLSSARPRWLGNWHSGSLVWWSRLQALFAYYVCLVSHSWHIFKRYSDVVILRRRTESAYLGGVSPSFGSWRMGCTSWWWRAYRHPVSSGLYWWWRFWIELGWGRSVLRRVKT